MKSVQQPETQPWLHALTSLFVFGPGGLGSFALHPAFRRNHLTPACKPFRLANTALPGRVGVMGRTSLEFLCAVSLEGAVPVNVISPADQSWDYFSI